MNLHTLLTEELFAEEQPLAVFPEPRGQVLDTWRRRLHVFSGRTLTDDGLTGEHRHRTGHLATRGQLLTRGVIDGLYVELSEDRTSIQLSPGFGVSASGEDIVLPRALSADIDRLHVYVPPEGADLDTAPVGNSALELRGPLADLGPVGGVWDRVMILVLEPIVAELAESDPDDPCEVDPEAAPFADWQLVDGVRLVLYPWPWSRNWPAAGDFPGWRNRLAYAVFDAERELLSGRVLPWERHGIGLGLVAFDDVGVALFLDRYAVRRAGGRVVTRPLVPQAGRPAMWQARIQQFVEELGERDLDALLADIPLRPFVRFPPVGFLPPAVMDLSLRESDEARVTRFFPAHFHLDAAPLPLSEVEAIIERSAGLGEVTYGGFARLQIHVPVPDHLYEPRLLIEETPDPRFAEAIAEASERRDQFLARRLDLRQKYIALVDGLDGTTATFPDPDPDRVDDIDEGDLPPIAGDPELDYGTSLDGGERVVDEVVALMDALPAGSDAALVGGGVVALVQALGTAVRTVEDGLNLHFVRVQADMYRLRQFVVDGGDATRLATSEVFANIAGKETATEYRTELNSFSALLKEHAAATAPPAEEVPDEEEEPEVNVSIMAHGLMLPASQPFTAMTMFPMMASFPAAPEPEPTLEFAGTAMFAGADFGFFKEYQAVAAAPWVLIPQFHHLNIAERLAEPASKGAWNYAVATKAEIVRWLVDLVEEAILPLEDVIVPAHGWDANVDTVLAGDITVQDLARFRNGEFNTPVIPAGTEADEGAYITAGVTALEETITVLRQIEGLTESFRSFIAQAEQARSNILGFIDNVRKRLGEMGVELAEARHDLSVARVLLTEEKQRVDGINQRRTRVLNESVAFLVYQRRREINVVDDVIAQTLPPARLPSPIPACVDRHVPAPPELTRMLDLMRESPAPWFPTTAPLLDRLDDAETMELSLRIATVRAARQAELSPLVSAAVASEGLFQQAIGTVLQAHGRQVKDRRAAVALRAVPMRPQRSWAQARAEAEEVLSLGDLIDGGHGHSDVSRDAADFLERVYRVAACLYERFGEVLPAVRLEWAERLSQYDASIDLHDLGALPRWDDASIEYTDRHDMQSMVDWLYQQVNSDNQPARALIHDLVRVCLLLASHAPVRRIITGRVRMATTVPLGGLVRIAVDARRVRIGAQVLLQTTAMQTVRAVVDDLEEGEVAARIVQAPQGNVQLAADALAQFVDAGSQADGFLGGAVAR